MCIKTNAFSRSLRNVFTVGVGILVDLPHPPCLIRDVRVIRPRRRVTYGGERKEVISGP